MLKVSNIPLGECKETFWRNWERGHQTGKKKDTFLCLRLTILKYFLVINFYGISHVHFFYSFLSFVPIPFKKM